MYVCVWSGVWGVDGGWMPLPTRPQRYCDPASLVHFDTPSFSPSNVIEKKMKERGKGRNKEEKEKKKKQVTRGHNIVADGWAGAANPHPHPTPHPTHLPIHRHTRKASKTLVFPLFDSITSTDGPMNRRTDGASYRVPCPQLKRC